MDKKLEDKLYKKYPKLFKERKLPLSKSAMARGIECSDGWYFLIDELCNYIQMQITDKKCEEVTIKQIKEKFGRLVFHTDNNINDKILGAISLATFLSYRVCENCGSTNNVETKSDSVGYISTLCSDCRKRIKRLVPKEKE